MVNNPQLSDVQLQVDTGEVYFAHSFMLYARCPLLAEMVNKRFLNLRATQRQKNKSSSVHLTVFIHPTQVHENGFGVQEEGVPAAQRVLVSDVPGQAVFALLQYLYTARFSIPSSLSLHLLELASRLDSCNCAGSAAFGFTRG